MKQKLYGYLIEDTLGAGTYGKVYKAYKEENPTELYAMKVVLREKDNAKLDMYMEREVDILKELNDEHIIKLKEFITAEKEYCSVFEYCNGGDLVSYRKLKGGRIDPVLAHNILVQIVSGLDVLYAKNIMHRDIKPSNILVNYKEDINNPLIKIGDFSFARLVKESRVELTLSEDMQPMSIVGTPRYTAPEIYNKEPYSFKTEIWSLGVSFYELICGMDCFSGETESDIINSMSKGFYRIPKELGLPIECLDFLSNCIQMLPENRFKWKELKEHRYVTKNEHEAFDINEFIKLNPVAKGIQIDGNYIFNTNRKYTFFIKEGTDKEENESSSIDFINSSEALEIKQSDSLKEEENELITLEEDPEYVKINNNSKEYIATKHDNIDITDKYFN